MKHNEKYLLLGLFKFYFYGFDGIVLMVLIVLVKLIDVFDMGLCENYILEV